MNNQLKYHYDKRRICNYILTSSLLISTLFLSISPKLRPCICWGCGSHTLRRYMYRNIDKQTALLGWLHFLCSLNNVVSYNVVKSIFSTLYYTCCHTHFSLLPLATKINLHSPVANKNNKIEFKLRVCEMYKSPLLVIAKSKLVTSTHCDNKE